MGAAMTAMGHGKPLAASVLITATFAFLVGGFGDPIAGGHWYGNRLRRGFDRTEYLSIMVRNESHAMTKCQMRRFNLNA